MKLGNLDSLDRMVPIEHDQKSEEARLCQQLMPLWQDMHLPTFLRRFTGSVTNAFSAVHQLV